MNFTEKFSRNVFIALIFMLGSMPFALAQDDYPTLFNTSESEDWSRMDAEPFMLRGRTLKLESQFLTGKGYSAVGQAIHLNLFDDAQFLAVAENIYTNPSGSVTWVGYLEGVEGGTATFVVNPDGVVAGSVVMPEGVFRIRIAGKDQHLVYQLDTQRMPPDAEPIEIETQDVKGETNQNVGLYADSGSQIDVLVVYTAAARSAAGGTSAINALVDLAVAETNTSYNNSGVNTQLSLVYKGEISYTESSNFSTNLNRLTGKTDGYMDNVHSLRDQYCADHVVLITNGTQYCGIANLMTTVSASFESSAFSVTARTCATGYFSFGHELGHNMGARHDWYVDSSTSPYIYNHGYTNAANGWRTIMAYNNACSAAGTSCTRIQYWSNPNVTYGGNAMGVGGSSVGSSANNALALNNSLATVANFRNSSAGSCGGSTGGGCSGDTYSGNLTGTNDYDYQPNGTYYYSSSSGTHAAELTGPGSADFDLYLWKWNGSSWSTVASSESSSSNESISYSGTAGYYVWRIFSYSGSGNYDICIETP